MCSAISAFREPHTPLHVVNDFQGLLAAINFIVQPGGIVLPPRCVPQIVVGNRVSFNVNSSVPHLFQLRPGYRLTARINPLRVDKQSERIAEFFQDRPGDVVLGVPFVVDRNDCTL